ncbi:MAG: CDGSH iron-sulfur domain-containing protein [Rickettsiales bacterium]|jgi:CDGSH-type Zn-finger protein|nr:CDGSH iron-sulfur domain-containing protein [Rickettsiales bacterium]
MEHKKPYIKITKDGPYMVYGLDKIAEKVILTDENGISVKYGDGETFKINVDPVAICRCGKSMNAPFCDGSHIEGGFDGTETAPKTPILKNAEVFKGPDMNLADNEKYCAFARFCDAGGRVWNLVMQGGAPADKLAAKEANLCPAGRLMMFTKSGEPMEDKYNPELNIIEDGGLRISGPLWVKGGILVESEDGSVYEVRQKQTLCRCGASGNKPFCNGAHASIRFHAHKSTEDK